MAVKQPDSDEYRGCWNCIFHDDSDGFVITYKYKGGSEE